MVSDFLEEEVKSTLDSCGSSKSQGPDGFNFGFLKEYWEIFKEEFMKMFKEFHEHDKLVKGLNPSIIVLISKKDDDAGLADFRQISLIGGVYKIIAKVLSIRVSMILGSIISDQQSAFIEGRQILDSVAILNEVINEVKSKKEACGDSIDWDYLRVLMRRFNFNEKWIMWIMECVSAARALVLINGSPTGEFQLEKGLGQGDPTLSLPFPYSR